MNPLQLSLSRAASCRASLIGAALSLLLSGCALADTVGFWSSAEARINDAFPVSEGLRNSRTSLMEASGGQRKDILTRFDARMKLRALNCAAGYRPSVFATAADIRKKIGSTTCFSDTDAELTLWSGMLRVGVILAKAPLKALPVKAPASTVAEGFISSAKLATQAPIALLEVVGRGTQVVDLETSRVLFTEPSGTTRAGQISPNGRLFVVSDGENSRIRETETGNVVVNLPGVHYFTFHWLDSRTVVYNRHSDTSSGRTVLVDLVSGKVMPVTWAPYADRAVPVPGTDNQFVFLASGKFTKVSVDRSTQEPSLSLVTQKQVPDPINWALNNSGITVDNTKYFSAGNTALRILDLSTLELQTVSFEPYWAQLAVATPDADQIVLMGVLPTNSNDAPRSLIYSISRGTVAPIDPSKGPSTRFLHALALGKYGSIVENKIEFFGPPAVQDEVPVTQFAAGLQHLVNQRKLATLNLQAPATQPANAGRDPRWPVPAPGSAAAAAEAAAAEATAAAAAAAAAVAAEAASRSFSRPERPEIRIPERKHRGS